MLDLVFGILKTIFKCQQRRSNGFRKSIIKLLQYGGCIIVATVILNIIRASTEKFGQQFSWIFGDIMLYLMIYIEFVSVLENMEEMAPASFFVRPVRRIITFQLRNLFEDTVHKSN
jgi:hypothetical protein